MSEPSAVRSRRILPQGVHPFPVLMATGWVIVYFVLAHAPLHHLWRPLIIVAVAGVILTLALTALAGRRPWLFVVGGTALVAAAGAWPFVAVVVALAGWRLGVDWLRRRSGRTPVREAPATQITRLAGIIAAAGLAVALVRVALTVPTIDTPALASPPVEPLPSIYLIMLDAYARADTLAESFGIDNSAFLTDLEQRGFHVAEESRSNYNKTQLTMASMFHARYADEIGALQERSGDYAGELRQVSAAINGSSPVLDTLEERGYWIASAPPPFGEVAFHRAHAVFESSAMTQFEERLLRTSIVGPMLSLVWPTFVLEQHREGVEDGIDAIGAISDTAPTDRPAFGYVHILSPHTPFVFTDDGSLPRPAPCYPRCGLWDARLIQLGYSKAEYGALLGDHLTWLNSQLVNAVDELIARDPDAVVILMSDHGTRVDNTDSAEQFRTLFAARTPGEPELFPDDVHAVNVMSTTLNAYLTTDLPMQPYRAWMLRETVLDTVPYQP